MNHHYVNKQTSIFMKELHIIDKILQITHAVAALPDVFTSLFFLIVFPLSLLPFFGTTFTQHSHNSYEGIYD